MADTHIKIKPVVPRVQYVGNGVTTDFAYSFAIFDETDMEVYIGDTKIDPDATVIIGEGDDAVEYPVYTITGVGEEDGGEVVFTVAPENDAIITLVRNVPVERMTDFQEGGTFRPKNLNDELDRQTAFCQQIEEALNRCVKVDVTSQIDPSAILPQVERLYQSVDNIDTVSEHVDEIDTVSNNMTDVNNCSTNMAAIQDAPTQASNAAGSANDAALSAQQAAISAAGTHFKLFHHDWFDYQLNDQSWLRADTFSWQDGTVYTNAYNHLANDYTNGTSTTETVGSYTITYVLAEDGHKITTDEATVANIYAESGVAWYYVLDTANTRFKLPRENPAREELIQVIRAKGDGKALGLTDGTNNGGIIAADAMYGKKDAYGANVGAYVTQVWSKNTTAIGVTTDSTKSGIISSMTDSTSVYKGKKYLYFYVGQFSQTAIEQTAGLNSELFNGKVDLNAANLSTQGKSLISGLGMPSNRYIDLTLGASETSYTAPANGYLFLAKMTTGSQNIQLWVNGSSRKNCDYFTCMNVSTSGTLAVSWVPVKKGNYVTVHYNTGGTTEMFRFIYAEGEPNV